MKKAISAKRLWDDDETIEDCVFPSDKLTPRSSWNRKHFKNSVKILHYGTKTTPKPFNPLEYQKILIFTW